MGLILPHQLLVIMCEGSENLIMKHSKELHRFFMFPQIFCLALKSRKQMTLLRTNFF